MKDGSLYRGATVSVFGDKVICDEQKKEQRKSRYDTHDVE